MVAGFPPASRSVIGVQFTLGHAGTMTVPQARRQARKLIVTFHRGQLSFSVFRENNSGTRMKCLMNPSMK